MRYDVLGPLRLTAPAGTVELPGGRARALLAWLVLNVNQPVGVESTVSVLWPAHPPASAAAQLRLAARALGELLGEDVIDASGRFVLRCASEAIDASRFATLIDDAMALTGRSEREQARAKLRVALGLWRGDPYPELDRALPAISVIDRLHERHHQAVEAGFGLDLAGPVDYRLVADLRAAVTVHPDRPRLWRQLALALYRTGRQVDALATLRTVTAQREAPDPQADALQVAILSQDPALLDGEPSGRSAEIRRLPHRM